MQLFPWRPAAPRGPAARAPGRGGRQKRMRSIASDRNARSNTHKANQEPCRPAACQCILTGQLAAVVFPLCCMPATQPFVCSIHICAGRLPAAHQGGHETNALSCLPDGVLHAFCGARAACGGHQHPREIEVCTDGGQSRASAQSAKARSLRCVFAVLRTLPSSQASGQ